MDRIGIEFGEEEMLRLICDGTIVGYRKLYRNEEGNVTYRQSLKLQPFNEYLHYIKYTSVNKGFRGYFTGDVFEIEDTDPRTGITRFITATLVFNQNDGLFELKRGNDKWHLWAASKKIGSIYRPGKDGE